MVLLLIGDIMVSRMEKYYTNKSISSKKRSEKNVELYDNIYVESEYSNIEGIATMDKNNEVDITKLRNTIKNRENYKRQKAFSSLKEDPLEEPETTNDFVEKEVKNYDIRDILTKAKDKKPVEDTPRSLDNTSYNILKDLKMNKVDKYKDFEEEELKELINTITSTSMLNQMNDEELGLNMFNLEDDNDEKLESSKTVKQLLEQARKYQEHNTDSNLDKSFFTSSLNFSKDDFEDADNYINKKSKRKILFRFLVFTGLLLLTTAIIVSVYLLIR